MIKEEIAYTDFNGNPQTRTAYFHLSKVEVVDMQLSVEGGFDQLIKNIGESNSFKDMIDIFKKILEMSYGVKSEDGQRFIKSKELWEEFTQCPAYEELYMKLATDSKAAEEFINNVLPDVKGMVDQMSSASE